MVEKTTQVSKTIRRLSIKPLDGGQERLETVVEERLAGQRLGDQIRSRAATRPGQGREMRKQPSVFAVCRPKNYKNHCFFLSTFWRDGFLDPPDDTFGSLKAYRRMDRASFPVVRIWLRAGAAGRGPGKSSSGQAALWRNPHAGVDFGRRGKHSCPSLDGL